MKTNDSFISGRRLFRRRTSGALCRLASGVLGAWALWVTTPDVRADEEVILHPGTITGEIRIMDPDNPGEFLPISSGNVRAWAQTPTNSYEARQVLSNTNRYTLVVEAGDAEGGSYPYSITLYFEVPKLRAHYSWQIAGVVVSEGETNVCDFETDALLDVQMNIVGENVEEMSPSAQCALDPGSSSFSVSCDRVQTNRLMVPVASPTSDQPYSVSARGYMGWYYLSPEKNTNVVVNAGQTTPVFFDVQPGYIQGTITLAGATFRSASIVAIVTKTATNAEGRAEMSLLNLSQLSNFRFPCVPAMSPNVRVRCTLSTDKGLYYGEYQYPDVPVGETAICNWDFNFTGSIAGKVSITEGVTKVFVSCS